MSTSLAELGEIEKARFKVPRYFTQAARSDRKAMRTLKRSGKREAKRQAIQAGVPPRAFRTGQGWGEGAASRIEGRAEKLLGPQLEQRASEIGRAAGQSAADEMVNRVPDAAAAAGTIAAANAQQGAEQAVATARSAFPSKKRIAAYALGGGAAFGAGAATPPLVMRHMDRKRHKQQEQFMADRMQENKRQGLYNSMNQPQWDLASVGNRRRQKQI